MKILVLVVFVGALAFTPVYIFDSMVMPELLSMKESYGTFDQTAQEIAAGKPPSR